MTSSTGFLSDFPPVPTRDWERAIRETVAGPEYAAKLMWHPEEGLAVKPYYRSEDLKGLKFLEAGPGEFPYVRGNRPTVGWRIRDEIQAATPEEANRSAIDAINGGAEEISFTGVSIENHADLALLVANLGQIPVRLEGLDQRSARLAADWFHAHPHSAEISADIDPLADIAFSAELCSIWPESRVFTVSGEDCGERGVGAIEQVAFVLSTAVEFLDAMLECGLGVASATDALGFSFAIGPHFFVEIAKLRAFRLAWARVVESFGGSVESSKPVVYTRTTRWNETIYDPQVNILRATTEAISAVLGGTDSLAVTPYDECYRKTDQASRRLARNLQLVLKREAVFARVSDPLGGAYVIEVLTNAIATKAWKMFQEFETAGGYRKAKVAGIMGSIIGRRTAERDASANQRRLVLTGTNRFANAGEKVLDRIDAHQSISNQRAAHRFEGMRLRTERAALKGDLPKVLLAEFGDGKMRNMRAQFAAEFLACAGLTGTARHVHSPLEVAEADAGMIVLCSSDPEYLPFADALMSALAQRNKRAQVVIAGYPDTAEQLKRIGVAEFIYAGCNALEVLEKLQQKLGIEG